MHNTKQLGFSFLRGFGPRFSILFGGQVHSPKTQPFHIVNRWSSNNSAGALASPLKLPVAGGRHLSDGSLVGVGSYGDYWSGTVDVTFSRYLYFYSTSAGMGNSAPARGGYVRCIKDD